jgi:chemotaxis protein MotB
MQTRGLDSSIEGVEKSETSEGVVYTILESVLYTPGSATLSKKGEETLAQVVKEIEEQYPGRALNIQGHTDNQPIRRSSWKSNWELGSARALAALHYLTQKHGVKGEMISATTFGEFQPRESNTTPENMAYNRRAVVVVKPAK